MALPPFLPTLLRTLSARASDSTAQLRPNWKPTRALLHGIDHVTKTQCGPQINKHSRFSSVARNFSSNLLTFLGAPSIKQTELINPGVDFKPLEQHETFLRLQSWTPTLDAIDVMFRHESRTPQTLQTLRVAKGHKDLRRSTLAFGRDPPRDSDSGKQKKPLCQLAKSWEEIQLMKHPVCNSASLVLKS